VWTWLRIRNEQDDHQEVAEEEEEEEEEAEQHEEHMTSVREIVFVKEKRARIALFDVYDYENDYEYDYDYEADGEDDCATRRKAFVFGYT